MTSGADMAAIAAAGAPAMIAKLRRLIRIHHHSGYIESGGADSSRRPGGPAGGFRRKIF